MKIIDFKRKGNAVRFYLGDDDLQDWWGDDWDDYPYECNAGEVYDEFVIAHRDMFFPFDSMVLEPCNGDFNSEYCKDDMKHKHIPCIVVIPKEIADDNWDDETTPGIFQKYAASKDARIQKFYFEDNMDPNWLTDEKSTAPITHGDIFRTKMCDENIASIIYGEMTATNDSRMSLIDTVERIIGKKFTSDETYISDIVNWLKYPAEVCNEEFSV